MNNNNNNELLRSLWVGFRVNGLGIAVRSLRWVHSSLFEVLRGLGCSRRLNR